MLWFAQGKKEVIRDAQVVLHGGDAGLNDWANARARVVNGHDERSSVCASQPVDGEAELSCCLGDKSLDSMETQ